MKQKINMRFILIAMIAVMVTVISITSIYYNLFTRQVRNDLRVQADLICDMGVFDAPLTGNAMDTIDLHMENDLLRITWVAPDGTVLYDNSTDASLMPSHANRPEISQAFKNGYGEVVRRSDTMNMNTFYYAVLLDNGTVLRVSTETHNIWSVFVTAFPVILALMLLIIGLCIILAHFLTKQLVKPIDTLAENIEDSTKIPVYKELIPFVDTIRTQHENILAAAKSRQDFTANVSHELKTPLTAISGYAELIEHHMVDDDQQTYMAREIGKSAERLLSLINDIIRLSELDHSEEGIGFEEFDLYELIKEGINALRMTAQKQGLTLTLEGEPCKIRGNKDMVQELLDNLCQNAIRYNKPGGTVAVEVWKEKGKPTLIVSDTGVGIPKDQQERVFERFYRVDKSRSKETGGTGLGLAIVKHIVELHGAEIFLESEVGEGTTIRVRF